MGLPVIPEASAEVEVGGQTVTVRALTRGQVIALGGLEDDVPEAEARMLAYATGTSIKEAKAWYASAPHWAVQPLIEKIAELSGVETDRPTNLNGA